MVLIIILILITFHIRFAILFFNVHVWGKSKSKTVKIYHVMCISICSSWSWFYWDNFGVLWEKKKLHAEGISLNSDILSKFPTVIMFGNAFQTWCSNFMMIQRWINPRSSFSWDRFGDVQEKERVLRGEGKTKLRGKGGAKSIVSLKIDLRCLYL